MTKIQKKNQMPDSKPDFGTKRTEVYCHECNRYFAVELNYNLNGNHKIRCPNCGHIHYRVIEKGIVTGERYNSSFAHMPMITYHAQNYTATYARSYETTGWSTGAWTTTTSGSTW